MNGAKIAENWIANGKIKYPKSASHLFENYEVLKGRKYEERFIEEYAGSWYAYHRARDIDIMLSYPKIMIPRLTPNVNFSLDN